MAPSRWSYVDDDVILNGNAVVMDGVVNGSLLASGNTVTINGTVNGDVIALGSQVTIGTKAVITGQPLCRRTICHN